jgi:hypothetical protein
MENQMTEISLDELDAIDGGNAGDWCTGFIGCIGKISETAGHEVGEFAVGFVCYFAGC